MNEFYEKSRRLSPDIYRRFTTAIELGKWPDGKELTDEQKTTVMEAVIIYESASLPDGMRTGDVKDKCRGDSEAESKGLRWQ